MSQSQRHLAIQSQLFSPRFIASSSRKKSLKAQLIHVVEGEVLVRLGRFEYVVRPGELFWIPANCLVATTTTKATRYVSVEVSQRTNATLPVQSGYLSNCSLLEAVLSKLAENIAQQLPSAYLQVVLHELGQLKPRLPNTQQAQQSVVGYKPLSKPLLAKLEVTLFIRDASKRLLSGENKQKLESELTSHLGEAFENIWLEHTGNSW